MVERSTAEMHDLMQQLYDVLKQRTHWAIPMVAMNLPNHNEQFLAATFGGAKLKATANPNDPLDLEILVQSVSTKEVCDKVYELFANNIILGVSQLGPLVSLAFLDLNQIGAQNGSKVCLDMAIVNMLHVTTAHETFSDMEAAIMRFDINKRKLPEHV